MPFVLQGGCGGTKRRHLGTSVDSSARLNSMVFRGPLVRNTAHFLLLRQGAS